MAAEGFIFLLAVLGVGFLLAGEWAFGLLLLAPFLLGFMEWSKKQGSDHCD